MNERAVTLTMGEIALLQEALDSYEYWEHRDYLPYNSGHIMVMDDQDFEAHLRRADESLRESMREAWAEVKAARELTDKLQAEMGRLRYRATFRPQEWVRDNAFDVDPEGDASWDVTEFVNTLVADETLTGEQRDAMLAKGRDLEDLLRQDPNAPHWVRAWQGPFETEIELYDATLERA